MAFNKRLTHHKEVSIPHTPLMEIIEIGGPLIKTLTDIGSENVGENLRQLRDKGEEVFGGIKHNIERARDLLFEPIKRYAYYTLGGLGLAISLYVAWRCFKCQRRQALEPPRVIISERLDGETARLRIEESSMWHTDVRHPYKETRITGHPNSRRTETRTGHQNAKPNDDESQGTPERKGINNWKYTSPIQRSRNCKEIPIFCNIEQTNQGRRINT